MVTIVCGIKSEQPVEMLLNALKRKGSDYLLINQLNLHETVRLRWKLTQNGISGKIQIGLNVLDIREINSVFQRFMNIEQIPKAIESPEIISETRSILQALVDLFDVLPVKIVNRRRAMMSNNSKPYQSILIRQAGFSIPDTLVTNVPTQAKRFINNNEPVIFKSISAIRSIVKKVDNDDLRRIDCLKLLPTQFQKMIEGFNVRIHVVGERTFATRIMTNATDYRYAYCENEKIRLEPFKLSKTLKEMCINLTKHLNLLFAGIDLLITKKKAYCLEVNTSPAYNFYEQHTKQPIADALSELLSS